VKRSTVVHWLLLLALTQSPLRLLAANQGALVRTKAGMVRGLSLSTGGRVFKGIPFAQPPVGALRWRDPQPVKSWPGVRDASKFGPACAQTKSDAYPGVAGTSQEDCLYLNIWTPKSGATPSAVMLWLYGGSNIVGTADFDFYDGESLSRRGVVVVTINFRGGVFGFFAHPGLSAESPHLTSGNYGLLDQVAALQWVHDNIGRFGGDPQRVTLFGQSSGAIDTSYLVASPLTKGLIQRAIQESGPPVRPVDTLNDAEQKGLEFGRALKSPTDPSKAVAFLRSLSTDELKISAARVMGDDPAVLQRPQVDGYVLPKSPAWIYRDGEELPIPLMVGNNLRETSRNYPPDVMRRWIHDNFGSHTLEAEAFYGWANGATGFDDPELGPTNVQIRADVRDRCAAVAEGIWHTEHHHKMYQYLFDLPIAGEAATRHAAEIPFVFGNLLPSGVYGGPFTQADRNVSNKLQRYWSNFAKTGNPNGAGLKTWPEFNAATRAYLEFKRKDGPSEGKNLRREICNIYIRAMKETVPSNTAGNYPQ
jgi:para-nitrobenzyl esterase